MICRSGLFLAQIYPSESEEGISLNVESKCTIIPLKILEKDPYNDSSDPVKADKFLIQCK